MTQSILATLVAAVVCYYALAVQVSAQETLGTLENVTEFPPENFTFCVNESGWCEIPDHFAGYQLVMAFGNPQCPQMVETFLMPYPFQCTSKYFGNPCPGMENACYLKRYSDEPIMLPGRICGAPYMPCVTRKPVPPTPMPPVPTTDVQETETPQATTASPIEMTQTPTQAAVPTTAAPVFVPTAGESVPVSTTAVPVFASPQPPPPLSHRPKQPSCGSSETRTPSAPTKTVTANPPKCTPKFTQPQPIIPTPNIRRRLLRGPW